jgi:hypothetical protein
MCISADKLVNAGHYRHLPVACVLWLARENWNVTINSGPVVAVVLEGRKDLLWTSALPQVFTLSSSGLDHIYCAFCLEYNPEIQRVFYVIYKQILLPDFNIPSAITELDRRELQMKLSRTNESKWTHHVVADQIWCRHSRNVVAFAHSAVALTAPI